MDDMVLLYRKYVSEMENLTNDAMMDEKAFRAYVSKHMLEMKNICIREGANTKGILYYTCWDQRDVKHCSIPVFGYYAEDEKVLAKMFQQLADEVVGDTHPNGKVEIRVLSKHDIERLWTEVWKNTNEIILHLKRSPVFYPGVEFTEEVYHEFFMHEDTELIAAFFENEMVGIIEWNKEGNAFVCGAHPSVNVGEAYVAPAYRGSGLARELLAFAEKRAHDYGAEYMWVEHGTANPNARGFWNKYFQTYQYELVRSISRCAIGRE